MNVHELMHGDWICVEESCNKEEPCNGRILAIRRGSKLRTPIQGNYEVEGTYEDTVPEDEEHYYGGWFMTSIKDISPILITPEILEKNGFLTNKHVYPYPYYEYINYEDKVKIGFAFPQGNRTSYKEPWVYIDSEHVLIAHLPCKYVHQLQHIFKVCGIEKDIRL